MYVSFTVFGRLGDLSFYLPQLLAVNSSGARSKGQWKDFDDEASTLHLFCGVGASALHHSMQVHRDTLSALAIQGNSMSWRVAERR